MPVIYITVLTESCPVAERAVVVLLIDHLYTACAVSINAKWSNVTAFVMMSVLPIITQKLMDFIPSPSLSGLCSHFLITLPRKCLQYYLNTLVCTKVVITNHSDIHTGPCLRRNALFSSVETRMLCANRPV